MKTVLITGANRGIGLEFSRQYAVAGWRVLACCRQPEKAAALNRISMQYPGLIHVYALDVADHEQIEHLSQLLSAVSIDLLINNAGVYPGSDKMDFGHANYEEWMHAFRINTMAPLKMAESFITQISNSTLKIIVTLTSQMGSITENTSGANYLYRSSKSAVNMVVKSLSVDLKHNGVTAILFHPGWVQTDMGGPNALITAEKSVSGMRQVISNLTPSDSGKFFAYDGKIIAW